MIFIHPAPRHHDRESTRRVLSSSRKSRAKDHESDLLVTTRSEPHTALDSQLLEKKVWRVEEKELHSHEIHPSDLFPSLKSYRILVTTFSN